MINAGNSVRTFLSFLILFESFIHICVCVCVCVYI